MKRAPRWAFRSSTMSGTGRAIKYIKDRRPDMRVLGVEPVRALREIGHGKGIPKEVLVQGDAHKLGFEDGQFDLVCEFGMLHHAKTGAAQKKACTGEQGVLKFDYVQS